MRRGGVPGTMKSASLSALQLPPLSTRALTRTLSSSATGADLKPYLSAGRIEDIGYEGHGTFNQMGGTNTVASNLYLGYQDLGTGTRTIIAQVAAETLGLKVGDIKVNIGDTNYPPSGTSGGSTTVGGVSSSTRKAGVDAIRLNWALGRFTELAVVFAAGGPACLDRRLPSGEACHEYDVRFSFVPEVTASAASGDSATMVKESMAVSSDPVGTGTPSAVSDHRTAWPPPEPDSRCGSCTPSTPSASPLRTCAPN